jgi:hypothetical protein
MKDDVLYRALYCGACKSIGKNCGQIGRFTLTYDIAFMNAICHNILGKDVEINKEHCVTHIIRKTSVAKPDEISLCLGDVNVILAYYKLLDDAIDEKKGGFKLLAPYGRTGEAIKIFPVTVDFYTEEERPWIAYDFFTQQEGTYRIRYYMAATTPVSFESKQYIGFSVNEDKIQIINTVRGENKPFFLSAQWTKEAYEHIKVTEAIVTCKAGINRLFVYGMSPAIVIERILLWREDTKLPESYLGPRESWRKQED